MRRTANRFPATRTTNWGLRLLLGAALLMPGASLFAEEAAPPARLSFEATQDARPMGAQPPAAMLLADPAQREAIVCELWDLLTEHQAGRLDAAAEGWRRLELPPTSEVWRRIALAAAQLELGDLSAAADALALAQAAQPDNSVVAYYYGILRLEQAAQAPEWNDAQGPLSVRLAANRSDDVYPNSKGVFRLRAAGHFERALELAAHLDRAQMLLPPGGNQADGPTVNDLLTALGADHYEATCHVILADHYLAAGLLEAAEVHLDLAWRSGTDVTYGYRELAREYEGLARWQDAARAAGKDLRTGPDVAVPLENLIRNLRLAVVSQW